MRFCFVICIIVLCGIVLPGCGRTSPRIELVVPDGYRGAICIVGSPASSNHADFQQGKYRIRVPSSGLLVLSDASMFRDWHKMSAVNNNGDVLPVLNSDLDSGTDEKVGLRSLSSRGDGTIWYCVGTEEERKSMLKERGDVAPGDRQKREGLKER